MFSKAKLLEDRIRKLSCDVFLSLLPSESEHDNISAIALSNRYFKVKVPEEIIHNITNAIVK